MAELLARVLLLFNELSLFGVPLARLNYIIYIWEFLSVRYYIWPAKLRRCWI